MVHSIDPFEWSMYFYANRALTVTIMMGVAHDLVSMIVPLRQLLTYFKEGWIG